MRTLMPVTRISWSVLCSVKGGASRWMDQNSLESTRWYKSRLAASEGGRATKITLMMVLTNGSLLIHGLSNDVQNASQRATADGHLRMRNREVKSGVPSSGWL